MCYNAICLLTETIIGSVQFEQCENDYTLVTFNLRGPPNETHAIHIHEFGDLRDGCKSLGSHWNPTNENHGSFFTDGVHHHAGDLINNITFDSNGLFQFSYTDVLIDVPSIYGRSIVIHADEDDLGLGGNRESKKTGNAGKRIACSIIGRSK